MGGETRYEVAAVEAFLQYLIEQQHAGLHFARQEVIHQLEVVFGAQDVQTLAYILIGELSAGEADHLVEDGECISHTAVSLLCDEVERVGFGLITFLLGHPLQVFDGILHAHAHEVIHLATAQNGGQDAMLLGGGQDEYHIRGRFFECLEEGVEGGCGEHVHLVDDENLVLAHLWRNEHLLAKFSHFIHRVVACRIQLLYVHRALFIESLATLALAARITVGQGRKAVDRLGKDACAGGLAHSARSAEQVGMRQFARCDGILERGGQRVLSHD